MKSSNGNLFRVTGLFVWGIHRSPVNSPHEGRWRGALMFFFFFICAWTNSWAHNGEAGDLRRHRGHYGVIVMICSENSLRNYQDFTRMCFYDGFHRWRKYQWTGWLLFPVTLRWRHNGRDDVSNHQSHNCLLNRSFRRRSKKTSKLRVTGLCAGIHRRPMNSPHKWPATRKLFPFDDVIMNLSPVQRQAITWTNELGLKKTNLNAIWIET